MRAFVAGATGYTGRAVVAALAGAGHTVTAHVRPGSRSLATVGPELEAAGATVDTTPWEPDAMRATLAALEPDLVFGLLGITRAGARREEQRTGVAPSYETVDYGLTALLADAAAALPDKPRFVYLSAVGTSAKTRNAYLAWRWKAEEHVRASGLPWTIARPSFITGDRDESRPLETVGGHVVTGAVKLLGAFGAKRLRDRYRQRTNTELAQALVAAALDPAWANRVVESEDLDRV